MSGSREGVIILGHPRSGTTLLRRLVGAHSSYHAGPETHLFSACARFLEADETAHGLQQGVLTGLSYCGVSPQDMIEKLRTFAFGILRDVASDHGKSTWVEKTAYNAFHIGEIARLCGDTIHYIGVLRHPFDVAISCVEFCNHTGAYPKPLHHYIQMFPQPIEAFVRSWIDTTDALFALGQKYPANVLTCRYEDLVTEPSGTLRDILSFLSASFESGMIERALTDREELGLSDHKTYATNRIHSDGIGRWRSLPTHQVSRLLPLVNSYLEKCGYETIQAAPPLSDEEARRRYEIGLALGANRQGSQSD